MREEAVSIIIVNWNGKKWLKKCLDSLRAQTYREFEIILVDNNSTDESLDFIQKNYTESNIQIIQSNQNLGFSGGNNLGIENAKGKFILLFNNDAWIEVDCLENLMRFYQENNFSVIAPIETDYENQTVNDRLMKIDFFGHPIYVQKDREDGGFYLPGVCLFFEKSLYQETQGLDDNFFMYLEEVDWFWRLNLLEKKFSFVKDVYIHHAGAGSTGGGIKRSAFLWRNQNSLQMLLKNYSLGTLLWTLPVYFLQNIGEMIFFLLLLKPKIAFTYLQGWLFVLSHLPSILEKRKWVQEHRVLSDLQLAQKTFYFGFAKVNHLFSFLKNNT